MSTAPGPKGQPLLGNLLEFGKDPLSFFLRLNRDYGGVARFKLTSKIAHLITDPELCKYVMLDNYKNYRKGKPYARARFAFGEGLITSDGEYWRRHRKLAQPAFSKDHYIDFAKIMSDAVHAMIPKWDRSIGKPVNIATELRNLALQIATRSLFTTDIENDAERLQHAFNEINAWFSSGSKTGFLIPPTAPTPSNLRMRKVMKEIDALIYRIIATRRRAKEPPKDLLGLLMAARDEDDGSSLSDGELRDESMTILFAAHETTGTTITWVLSMLSKYPEVERRMHSEVTRVLGKRDPSFTDTFQLAYSKQIMEETMRLCPAGPIIPREVVNDDRIGGHEIPAGSVVFLSPYVMHRDVRFWENPEAFDPDRFTPENVAKRHKYSYMPFVLGPRQCIGNHFAMTEMLVAVPMILQRYQFQLVPGMQIGAKHLRFNEGMWMTLSRRAEPSPLTVRADAGVALES